ncbi:DUF2538 family protein [Paenibacillus flagellatus]|nr:DUF2538 family protein [Paenibacillus flagellatus]
MPTTGADSMYFSSKDETTHRERYERLLARYEAGEDEPELAAACYVLAYPGIYEAIPDGRTGGNPFTWYWGPYDTTLERRTESEAVGGLPPGLRQLVRAAAELYAGRPLFFDLAAAVRDWDADMTAAFAQTIALRRGESRR